jgi:NAD-dependent dihydropyrimidine dehydrogenase PreA subunit
MLPMGRLQRADGLVIIDPDKAAGHPQIVESCPNGAIYGNDELDVPQKCTGCAHLLEEGWGQTRCSQGCPTGALKLVLADDAEMVALIKDQGLEPYRAGLRTDPRVYYKDLYRWTKAFIAGTTVFADTGDCAPGCEVTISKDGSVVAKTTTNNFGDFLVDKLDAGAEYTVGIAAVGYKPVECRAVPTAASLTLPALFLERSQHAG